MTMCCVYIGDLSDPRFSWEEGDWNGNVPMSISKEFPSPRGHYNAQFKTWMKEKDRVWKQTDYGGWVAKVTKSQIKDFVDYVYGADDRYVGGEPWDHLLEKLEEIKTFVDGLDDHKIYALVATEF